MADRALWATVSQWREDQATNLWLGLNFFRQSTPVGLISSVGLPNANGMPLLAIPLSWLPNLLVVSTVLGCLQALAATWLCRKAKVPRAWLVLLPLLTSVHLRGAGNEFWNNWIFIPIDMAFVALVLREMEQSRRWHAAVAALFVALSPALYLAGLVNALAFAGLWWIVRRHRPAVPVSGQRWTKLAVIIVLITAGIVVWIPYVRNISGQSFVGLPHRGVAARLGDAAIGVCVGVVAPLRRVQPDLAPLLVSNPAIVSAGAVEMLWLSTALLSVQLALTLLCVGAYARSRLHGQGPPLPPAVSVVVGFLAVCYGLAPLLGGAKWYFGERLDQSLQFWPFELLLLFGLPFWLESSRWLQRLSGSVALAFSAVSMVAGVLIVMSHLEYRGPVISAADVPLWHKEQAIRWIARDWRLRSAAPVPVAYAVVGPWEWLPEFNKLDPWYPGQMSVGRGFDYELLRRFGLHNAFEGRRAQAAHGARYTVSYASEPIPSSVQPMATHHLFGRLRVSVVD